MTVRGPSPDRLGIPIDTEARVRFVVDNLQSYWASLADDVGRATTEQPDRAFSGDSFVWVALGALRLHYTAFTGDVTSKRGAGEYGLVNAPAEFHDMLRTALTMRANGEQGEAPSALMAEAGALARWVVDDTTAAFDNR